MSSIGLLIISALTLAPASFQVLEKNAHSPMAQAMQGKYIIAQQYDGDDPHGKDPHGSDPHDQKHDLGLPANSNVNYPANTDMTGGVTGNNNSPAPYNGSNY
jgi:hypothetical protein